MAPQPSKIQNYREQMPVLCETFGRDQMISILKKYGFEGITRSLDGYIQSGWIEPLADGRFHRGHVLVLIRLATCNQIPFEAGLASEYDFEDIMARRVRLIELESKHIRDDARCVNTLYQWLFSNNPGEFDALSAMHVKAVIESMLETIDPNGFFENLRVEQSSGDGCYLLVKDLIQMMSDIVKVVTTAGSGFPTVQYIFDRKRQYDEISKLMMPLDSMFLATPRRDMMADERMDFINQRNQLLIDKKYQELVDLYLGHMDLFESEVKLHAKLSVCLGHIYGDLLKDNEKAAASFAEAIEYDPSNEAAFGEISHHLREAGKWDELIELLSNHWDTIDDPQKRCALILDAAQIHAFKCQNINEAIGLYERCMLEGCPGNDFDNLYKIIAGLMDDFTDLEKMRALVTLTLHIVNYPQCDKVTALQTKFDTSVEPLARCMSLLVDAGCESFRGDQPKALDLVREALVQSPTTNLIDGVLLRIATQMRAPNEFRESINDLESEDLSSEALSDAWLKIANVLVKVKHFQTLALEYAEKSVAANNNNLAAIDQSYKIALSAGLKEKSFVYATVRAARTKDAKKREELENTCDELRLAISDDDNKLMTAYESLLQFNDVKDKASDSLRELILGVDDQKAIDFLQRIEPSCMAAGLLSLVGELYESVLERDISTELRKDLLEKYLGILLGQGGTMDTDRFVQTHAQLYALAPSDRLYTMLKSTLKTNTSAFQTWTGALEDAAANISDLPRLSKLMTTLADCYQNILKDADKTADTYANLLKKSPNDVGCFKSCFDCFESLERYFECTEICKHFPIETLPQADQIKYASKCLEYSLIHGYDAKDASSFVRIISKNDESTLPEILSQIIQKIDNSGDSDQILSYLQQFENENTGLTSFAFKLARAQLLIKLDRKSDAAKLLDRKTKDDATKLGQISNGRAIVSQLEGCSEFDEINGIWNSTPQVPPPASKAILPPSPARPVPPAGQTLSNSGAQPKIHRPVPQPAIPRADATPSGDNAVVAPAATDEIVKRCAESPEADLSAEINAELQNRQPDDASALCVRIASTYEAAKNLTEAENYYKKAFGYNHASELIEFYKRYRQFKKAVKLLNFKLAKVSGSAKTPLLLDLALSYEQLRKYPEAIQSLNDVLESDKSIDKPTKIAVLKQKAAYQLASGTPADAIATLKQASADADFKSREEIDIDTCLLMREFAPDEAKKLHSKLVLRGAKSEKMQLLTLSFDIDAQKFTEANNRLNTLLAANDTAIVISAMEQKIRLQKAREDTPDEIRKTANELLALSPENAIAKAVLNA